MTNNEKNKSHNCNKCICSITSNNKLKENINKWIDSKPSSNLFIMNALEEFKEKLNDGKFDDEV